VSSIFSKIIDGSIPSVKVHEDDFSMAIMDINPIQKGQVLVFPRLEVGTVWDLPLKNYQALMETVQKVGQRIRMVFPDKAKVGVIIEGLEVTDHAHVKVFPFSTVEEFNAVPIIHLSQVELQEIANRLMF
jgi:histidine triad (HIT) family protein